MFRGRFVYRNQATNDIPSLIIDRLIEEARGQRRILLQFFIGDNLSPAGRIIPVLMVGWPYINDGGNRKVLWWRPNSNNRKQADQTSSKTRDFHEEA
ncbi:hypothetical protein D9M73_293970 [compost metagenome]